LTAVCQDAQRLGGQAMRKLVASMPDRDATAEIDDSSLLAWFEVNESTGPAPAE
jgi:hypothetical protein